MNQATIVLATRNKGKVAELADALQAYGLTVLGLDHFPDIGEIDETGTTFEENALIKACAVAKASGHIAVADDSGLEVDALDKAPGVYSARYSDDSPHLVGATRDDRNNTKLLLALENIPAEQRTARFRCVMAVCTPQGAQLVADGSWEGFIAKQLQGDNGFGYDPLFVDAESGMHAAELTKEAKLARSHRGKALRSLMKLWPAFWEAQKA